MPDPVGDAELTHLRSPRGVTRTAALGWAAGVLLLLRRDLGLSCFGASVTGVAFLVALLASSLLLARGKILAMLTCVLFLFAATIGKVPDYLFVMRRLGEFDAVLAWGKEHPSGAYSVERFSKETVFEYPMCDNWSDSYWVIYEHASPPILNPAQHATSSSNSRDSMSFWEWHHRREDSVHLWGPWRIYID
jgi:hypothetical protein